MLGAPDDGGGGGGASSAGKRRQDGRLPVVLDPVLVRDLRGGARQRRGGGRHAATTCSRWQSVITPNLAEAERLAGYARSHRREAVVRAGPPSARHRGRGRLARERRDTAEGAAAPTTCSSTARVSTGSRRRGSRRGTRTARAAPCRPRSRRSWRGARRLGAGGAPGQGLPWPSACAGAEALERRRRRRAGRSFRRLAVARRR